MGRGKTFKRFTELTNELNVNEFPIGSCVKWKYCKDKDGYGILEHPDGYTGRLHRLVIQHFLLRKLKPGEHVLHKCDEPSCYNPIHLKLGTHKENNQDKISKGRDVNTRGERNFNSKMTDAQRAEMVSRYQAGGVTFKQLAKEYGITTCSASSYVRRLLKRVYT